MVTLNISLADGTIEIEADHDQIDQVAASAIKLIEALAASSGGAAIQRLVTTSSEVPSSPPQAGDQGSAEAARRPKARKGSGKTRNWNFLPKLFDDEGWAKLTDFYKSKSPTGQNEQVAVITSFVSETLKREGVDGNELHSCFKTLGIKTPANLTGVLGNMATAGLGHSTDGKFFLDFKGNQMVDMDLPRAQAKAK
jgi:hypothetical protein